MSGEAGDEPRAAAPGVGDVEDDSDATAADTSVGADADAAPATAPSPSKKERKSKTDGKSKKKKKKKAKAEATAGTDPGLDRNDATNATASLASGPDADAAAEGGDPGATATPAPGQGTDAVASAAASPTRQAAGADDDDDDDDDNDDNDAGPDGHGSHTGVFMATFNGQIESGTFPFHDQLYCTFGFVFGQDWQVIAGIQEGATQVTRKPQSGEDKFAWNFPVEVTFKSTNPFGWPQIFLQVYGLDGLGREVVRGYGATHLPLSPGRHTVDVDMFVPVPSSVLKRFAGYMLGTRAEFIDPKFVTSATGRAVTRVQSQGSVRLSLSVVTKDFNRYGFRVESGGQNAST